MTDEEKKIIEEVDNRVKKEFEDKLEPDMLGYIHLFEKRKKEILKKEYGIDFETKQEKFKYISLD